MTLIIRKDKRNGFENGDFQENNQKELDAVCTKPGEEYEQALYFQTLQLPENIGLHYLHLPQQAGLAALA